MDIQPDDPKTWFAGVAALFAGLLTWNTKRFINQQDRHSTRLAALEADRVTKGDVTAIYERIEKMSEQSHEQYKDLSGQHRRILEILVDQK